SGACSTSRRSAFARSKTGPSRSSRPGPSSRTSVSGSRSPNSTGLGAETDRCRIAHDGILKIPSDTADPLCDGFRRGASVGRREVRRRMARLDRDQDPIGPFLYYLMGECGVSPHTLAAYRADLMRFVRWRRQVAPGPLSRLNVTKLTVYV